MKVSDIVTCGQLACILEVSSPKPGNVSRFKDFEDTKFEHFAAACIGIGEALRLASGRGIAIGSGEMDASGLRLGALIRKAVEDSRGWHSGGNTNLGTTILLIPLAAAAGISLAVHGEIKNNVLRDGIDRLVRESTFQDTIELYQAIRYARPGGLGRVERLDVTDKTVDIEIKEKDVNLYRIFSISREEDSIARELVTKMAITFEVGYPTLMEAYNRGEEVSRCIQLTFFEILSRYPDTLIARKNGRAVAHEISREAKSIKAGGLLDEKVLAFDDKLRSRGNKLNPGVTADLVASSLNVALLNGLKVR
jgi:triphosphoribosyl-dephospho-CoA synthase